MNTRDVIFLAGHKGLVGSSVHKELNSQNFKNILTIEKKRINLRNFEKLIKYFKNKKLDYIVMAAARAGGILANSNNQKDFFFENIEIQNSLLKLAIYKKVKRVIFLGSSCIYPKFARNPIKEESLLTGKLEKTNECYAIAKIAGIKLCEAIFEKDNLDIVCLMPTNLYGINDNFDKTNGHVIPSMISKFLEAKKLNKRSIQLLGTGKPIREFLYVDDLSKLIAMMIKLPKKKLQKTYGKKLPILNVGSGESVSIKELSKIISKEVGYKGKIIFNKSFPDGTFKKNLNSNKIKKIGWKPIIKLKSGINKVVSSL